MAERDFTKDPTYTACAVSSGRVMFAREPYQNEGDPVVLGCFDSKSARSLADKLHQAADVADRTSEQRREFTAPSPQVDFMAMRNVLVLAAFAAEARRVLSEIDFAVGVFPEMDKQLSGMVHARNQWREHEDTIPEVLGDVAEQLAALAREEK